MENALLIQQIESLPKAVQRQIVDFVAFLSEKYRSSEADFDEFSEAEMAELQARSDRFRVAPDEAMDFAEFKKRLKDKTLFDHTSKNRPASVG